MGETFRSFAPPMAEEVVSRANVQMGMHSRMQPQQDQHSHLHQYETNFQLPYAGAVSDQCDQVSARDGSPYYTSQQQQFSYQTHVPGSYMGSGAVGYHDAAEAARSTAGGSGMPSYHSTSSPYTSMQQLTDMTFGQARKHPFSTTQPPLNYSGGPYGECTESVIRWSNCSAFLSVCPVQTLAHACASQ